MLNRFSPLRQLWLVLSLLCVCSIKQSFAQSNTVPDSLSILKKIDTAIVYLKINTERSASEFAQARDWLKLNPNPYLEARMYIGLGTYERMRGNPTKAMEYRLKSLTLHEQLGDSLGISINLHNIAVIFRDQKKYKEAAAYLKKAISIKEKLDDVRELAQSYNVLGMIYRRQKKYALAEQHYNIAYDLVTKVKDRDLQISIKGNLATLYSVQKKYGKSIAINKAALPYYDSVKKLSSLASRYYNIGYSYYRLKKYDSAHVYVDKAIAIARKEKLKVNIANYYGRRSHIFRKQKKYKEALKAFRAYKKVYDSVYNIRNAEQIKEMLLRREFKNQQAMDSISYAESEKRLVLEAGIQQQRKNLYLVLFVVALVLIIVSYYAFNIKRKLLRSELEMTSLQKSMLNERLESTYKETEQILVNTKAQTKYRSKIIRRLKTFLEERNTETVFKEIKLLQLELEHQNRKSRKANALAQDRLKEAPIKFEDKLTQNFPDLTKNEREVCSLIRANMSIKEIANVRDVSSASIQSMRYRIRKKLELKQGDDLPSFLQNL